MELYEMRENYAPESLTKESIHENPFAQFGIWFHEAIAKEVEPNAMVLSTVGADMSPSSRVVLLKKFSPDGFVFFTNYQSKKGVQLSENPRTALLFFWPISIRQVRIEGLVEKLPSVESDEYFNSRPLESRATALLSRQSFPLESRKKFEADIVRLCERGSEIKRPEHWGGYFLWPHLFEFWQGRANRAHDRFQYSLSEKGWEIRCLYP
ncbi:MAG: pyridoxamine 5'-phosphate oxidase [Bacteroidales bacterium]